MIKETLYVGSHPVKLICSCIRQVERFNQFNAKLATVNDTPQDGDIVVVRSMSNDGAYTHVENSLGTPVRIYSNDVFVAVLGTRLSGTNLTGIVPDTKLSIGDQLELIAQGGLIGKVTSVPEYYGSQAMPLKIVGFCCNHEGNIANISQSPPIYNLGKQIQLNGNNILFVAGTSAEAGKTTFVCQFNLALKRIHPRIKTAAIKMCGTGRAKDSLNFQHANYDIVVDFVDAGFPPTYNIDEPTFREALSSLISHCEERSDITVVEIGGDFLEARAPDALKFMSEIGSTCVLLANDAMGAIEGMERLQSIGVSPIGIGSYRQNLHALAKRLNVPDEIVFNPMDENKIEIIARKYLVGNLL